MGGIFTVKFISVNIEIHYENYIPIDRSCSDDSELYFSFSVASILTEIWPFYFVNTSLPGWEFWFFLRFLANFVRRVPRSPKP